MNTEQTAAELVAAALIAATPSPPVSLPTAGQPWPCSVGNLPTAPDNAVVVYDMPGFRDQRMMRTGETDFKPGVMIHVRAVHYHDGVVKLGQIVNALDKLANFVHKGVCLQNVNIRDTPCWVGTEEGQKRRNLFSLNATVTMQ